MNPDGFSLSGVTSLVNGATGLVTALAGLIGGLASLTTALQRSRERKKKPMSKERKSSKGFWVLGTILLAISSSVFIARATNQEVLSSNTRMTNAAWAAFNAKDYSNAIAKAQQCIDEFVGGANREQAELEKKNTPLPPNGKVSSTEKDVIMERGLLNDVATCYFIAGRSAEYLKNIELARTSYLQAAKYTYARTWDPGGWFWSPAEAAADRLSQLK